MGRPSKASKPAARVERTRPNRFAWFFGFHVFDLVRVRELAERKPILTLTTVESLSPLLEDGYTDLDQLPAVSLFEPVTIGRVPIGDGTERYVLLDGYEVVSKCLGQGKPVRLRVLSAAESKACRLDSESLGDW